jgi:hypothetical protein
MMKVYIIQEPRCRAEAVCAAAGSAHALGDDRVFGFDVFFHLPFGWDHGVILCSV